MHDLLEGLGKLLTDFSPRRLVGLLVLFSLIALGVVLFERATNTFRLSRIERIAALTERLHRLDSLRVDTDSSLRDVQAALKSELRAAALTAPGPSLLPVLAPPSFAVAIRRFLSGAAVWVLFAFGLAAENGKTQQLRQRASRGHELSPEQQLKVAQLPYAERMVNSAGAMAFMFGVLSVFLPLGENSWFLWLGYPLVVLVAGLGLASVMELGKGERQTPALQQEGARSAGVSRPAD